ncbi:MAG: hypothetical protein V4534_06460 [Myxococcota bacterium]
MRFEENLGQWPEKVLFAGRGGESRLFAFTKKGLTLNNGLEISFQNSNPNPEVYGGNATGGKSAYYVGNQLYWAENVRHFGSIVYKSMYPGIDIVFYPSDNAIEYDFIVAPGADASRIELSLNGQKSTRLTKTGDLLVSSAVGRILLKKPISYQLNQAGKNEIASAYRVIDKKRVAFDLGSYDRSKELVIDPVVAMGGSAYLEGSAQEVVLTIDYNSATSAIAVGGWSKSSNFFKKFNATSSYNDNTLGGSADGFITITSSDGSAINYSVFVGGTITDVVSSLKMDTAGNVYAVGYTNSTAFPHPTTPWSTTGSGDFDGFAIKLTRNATDRYTLTYSVQINGTGSTFQQATQLVLDTTTSGCTTAGSACAAIVGTTTASDTLGDALFIKLSSTFTTASPGIAARIIGGTGRDVGQAIILGPSNVPIIAGETRSSSTWKRGDGTLTTAAPITLAGTQNLFVARLSATGLLPAANTTTNWIRGIPTSGGIQSIGGLETGSTTASFIISGTTNANLTGFGGSRPGGLDIFVGKYSTTLATAGSQLAVTTGNYRGGVGDDLQYAPQSLYVDASENIFITGMTSPAGFIATSNFTAGSGDTAGFGACRAGGTNAFISKFTLGASAPTIDYTVCLSSATSTTTSTLFSLSSLGNRGIRDLGSTIVSYTIAASGSAPNCRCGRTVVLAAGLTHSYIGSVTSGNNHNGGFPFLNQPALQGDDTTAFSGAAFDAFVSAILQADAPLAGCGGTCV